MRITQTLTKLRVLDFDIENRPLSYWYEGNPTAEITAIAWSWVGEDEVTTYLLGEDDPAFMLRKFVEVYEEADLVTGHYIRKHDLPIINGALMEFRMPPLGVVLSHDTKMDLRKRDGLSMSQEALSAMYGLKSPKEHMTQQDWRSANRLTPEGLKETRRRVEGDVVQHKHLYATLRKQGWLNVPKVWRP